MSSESFYAAIMAGGSGTRLWPLSRAGRPKQVLKLIGERTMFQIAVERLAPLFTPDRILTITSGDLADELCRQAPQLPRENIVVEPEGRGTAPVIGLGALHIRRRDPNAVIACLTADHYIADVIRFRDVLAAAAQIARQGFVVTLGIRPTFPAIGFGYIERGDSLGTFHGFEAYRVARFKEKPSAATAAEFLADGRHSWNSGMFIWSVARVLAEFERLVPETFAKLMEIDAALGGPHETETLARVWPTVPKNTIDYAIMERAGDVAVIPADGLGWSDVGSWASLLDVLDPDESGNVVLNGDHVGIDTNGSLIYTDRLVATIGVSDLIIIDTDDALLVCPRDRAQEVRTIVDELQRRKAAADEKQPPIV